MLIVLHLPITSMEPNIPQVFNVVTKERAKYESSEERGIESNTAEGGLPPLGRWGHIPSLFLLLYRTNESNKHKVGRREGRPAGTWGPKRARC